MARLDAAEQGLLRHSRAVAPTGLTEPDEGATERWEAGQVWAHIAEFVPYWHRQIESVVSAYDGTPVQFGRVKTDPGRIAAIETGRHESIATQMVQTHEAIASLKTYLGGLTLVQWGSIGVHPARGEMNVGQMVERFEVDHLEEHVAQLDGLG